MLTLATLKSRASVSIVGFIARHGGHHGAQKSTSTGSADSSTSRFQLKSCSSMVRLAPFLFYTAEATRTQHEFSVPRFFANPEGWRERQKQQMQETRQIEEGKRRRTQMY